MQLRIAKVLKNTIVYMAKKSANLDANTACTCIGYQPKEPKNVKKLRRF